MEQSIREMLENDEVELAHRIAEVEKALQRKYGAKVAISGAKVDLALLQRAIDEGVFSSKRGSELQSVGLAVGNVAANELGLKWVMVEDEYGTDPALQDPDTEEVFQALTLISGHLGED